MWRNTFKLLTSRHIFSLISSSLFSLNYDQTETWWLIIATSFVDGKHQSVCRHWAALSIAFRRQVGSYLLKYTYIPAYWYVHIHIYVYAHLYIQTHIYGTQTSSCQLWQLWSSIKAHSGGRQTIDPKEADIAESVGLELIDHGLKDLWGYRQGAPSVERVCKFLTAAKQTLHINSNCF